LTTPIRANDIEKLEPSSWNETEGGAPAPEAASASEAVSEAPEASSAPSTPSSPPSAVAEPVETKPRPFQSLLDLLHDLAIAVVVCVLLITYVVQAFKVQGTSMSPELLDGERILVNKFFHYVTDIHRGDVVVFWYPEDPELSFIKRVVGLPGENIEIRSGAVYVNGSLLEELYVEPEKADHRSFPSQEVRPGHFFVLGDNRRGSNDSRTWGLVPERYIYGKAFMRIWPPRQFGLVR
jgi:signal peptidase I